MARLIIVEKGRKRIYDICEDVVRIGSAADNNIEVADPVASKNHCEIRRVQKGFKLIDLESKEGTRVNGEFANNKVLDPGDEITIGDATLVFEGAKNVEIVASRGPGRAPHKRPAPVASPRRARAPVALSRDDDEERPRYRRESSGLPGWGIGLIVGGAAVLLVVIILGFISSSGSDDPGVTRIRQARALFEKDQYEEALAKLKEIETLSGVPDWAMREKERLAEECQKHIDAQLEWRLYQQAKEDMNEIIRFSNDYPIEVQEINRKLDAVVSKYTGKADLLARLQPDIDRMRQRFPLKDAPR